ncbi:exodeoxyribonuclease VIII, partial [Escherichia coli]
CTACGQNGGGHCPDCDPVMGDETYAETFGENETTDGDDQAQMKNEYIQENAVDTTQEHDSVIHIAPDSDASDNNDDSEQADFDWKRQLVLAAVYGLCANPACVATAPAIPDIAIMIANRLGNFGGDKS